VYKAKEETKQQVLVLKCHGRMPFNSLIRSNYQRIARAQTYLLAEKQTNIPFKSEVADLIV
jgi:hypothetical protein